MGRWYMICGISRIGTVCHFHKCFHSSVFASCNCALSQNKYISGMALHHLKWRLCSTLQLCFTLQGAQEGSVVKHLKLKHSPASHADETVHHFWTNHQSLAHAFDSGRIFNCLFCLPLLFALLTETCRCL